MFINLTVHSRDDKVASYSRNDILAGIKGSPASDYVNLNFQYDNRLLNKPTNPRHKSTQF